VKRILKAFLVCILLCSAALPVSSQSPWIWGYSVSLDGFSSQTKLHPQEHLGFHLFIDPFGKEPFLPDISAGILLPTGVNSSGHIFYDVQIGLPVLSLDDHPFSGLLRRESTLIPGISAGVMFGGKLQGRPVISASLEPVSLYFGDRILRFLGIRITYCIKEQTTGWGLRIFDLSHFLF